MSRTKASSSFVLDCSVTMAWCFDDENNSDADAALDSLQHSVARVPAIWTLEVTNVLLTARRKKRITEVQCSNFTDHLAMLPILVDTTTTKRAMHSILSLAFETGLSAYDAAYLELAIREQIPLLTLDVNLRKVAEKRGVVCKLS